MLARLESSTRLQGFCSLSTAPLLQAERWGAELLTEDVDEVDLSVRPFRIKTSETEVSQSNLWHGEDCPAAHTSCWGGCRHVGKAVADKLQAQRHQVLRLAAAPVLFKRRCRWLSGAAATCFVAMRCCEQHFGQICSLKAVPHE